jgi:RNA polymerase sigma factor (sigma-70 family)
MICVLNNSIPPSNYCFRIVFMFQEKLKIYFRNPFHQAVRTSDNTYPMRNLKHTYSEEILIRLLEEQNPTGATALYDMYSATLFGVISRINPDQAQAEDVLQDTFLRIWQSFRHYQKDKGRLFTWMVNVARNLSVDCLRSKSYRKNQQTGGLDGCVQIEGKTTDCDMRIDNGIIRLRVDKLRSSEMDIIKLIYYKGYTQVEAAKILGLPLGTLKTRLIKTIKRLRAFYVDNNLALAC